MPAPPVISSARRELRRYGDELRASQSFLAGEVGQPGWLNLGQFRWRNVTWGRAARSTVGVLTPLIIGFATGHVEYGTFAAFGALPAGTVAFQGVTRSRVAIVTVAVIGMAISTFVGGACAADAPWALVPAIVLWAYLAGLSAAISPTAIIVTLQWPVAVLIASAVPLHAADAALRALLVLAGGLFQAVLVVSGWAFSQSSAERTAMAASYATLSRYAAEVAAGQHEPPPPDTMPGTTALRDPNPLMRTAAREYLVDLMEESERIRTTLSVLHAPGGPDAGQPTGRAGGHQNSQRQEFLRAAARCLDDVAQALRVRPGRRDAYLEASQAALQLAPLAAGHSASWADERLRGQLRAAIRLTERLNDVQPGWSWRPRRRQSTRLPARDMLVTLSANVGTSSEAGRHALRLALVAGLAQLIAQASHLPHGYWATLTVLIVLRPDYSSTLYRGLQRTAGTIVGAGLGVVTVLLGHFGSPVLLTVLGLSLFGSYAVLQVNYLFFAVFLTDYVVVLLALLGLPADQTALDRLAGTGIGAALALLAYVMWPTWERTSASEKFARLFQTECRYAENLLRSWSAPAGEQSVRAVPSKLGARRARLDADASADRLADEPDRPPMTRELAQALLAAGHRLAVATLMLEAAVGTHHAALRRLSQDETEPAEPDPLQEDLDRLAGMVGQAGLALNHSLRKLQPPGQLPPLREVQSAIPHDDPATSTLYAGTDSMVDTLNTAAEILREALGTRRNPVQPGHQGPKLVT
jgi:uncharacterized membrane protein YccC